MHDRPVRPAPASSCAYSIVTWLSSRYTNVLPTMTGQRSVVQKNSLRSAYSPPPALTAAASAQVPSSFNATDPRRRACHRVAEMAERHVGTVDCGSGPDREPKRSRPCFATAAPTLVRLFSQAWSYATKPKSAPYRRPISNMISRGRSFSSRDMISPRHCSHSVYFRPRYGLLIGKSWRGQRTLLMVCNRQCRCCATGSSAGCHIAACESPTSATVVGDAVSPDAHSG